MSFFKRKDKMAEDGQQEIEDVQTESEQEADEGRSRRGRKRRAKKPRKNDMLASVVNESVVENVLSAMRLNDAFTTRRRDQIVHVGLFLDCDSIGGLSKNAAKADEDKGALIECIKSDRIKVLCTPALLDINKLVIIPDAETLDAAVEFSVLADATYQFFFVEDDGRQMDLEGTADVTLAEAQSVLDGEETIDELMARKGVEWVEGALDSVSMPQHMAEFDATADIPDVADADMPDATTVMPAPVDDIPDMTIPDFEDDDPVMMENEPASVVQGEAPQGDIDLGDLDDLGGVEDFADEQMSADAGEDIVSQQPAPSVVSEPVEQAPEEPQESVEEPGLVVSPEQMQDTISRTFFSKELGLSIPMDAFDAQFVQGNDVVYFDENRDPDVWLNNYLNQQAAEANADMRRMHENHIYQLRDLYQRLVAQCITQINTLLDDTSDKTIYGQRAHACRERYAKQREDIDMVARDRARVIRDDYEAEVRRAGESAARQAERTYREQHGKDVEAKIGSIRMSVQREMKLDLSNSLQELSSERRREAAIRLDLGVTTILASLSREYSKLRDIEDARYEEHRAAIAAYVNENRENDIAWANSIDRELESHDKAEAVRSEYTARMKAQQDEFEKRIESLRDEIAQMEDRNRRALADKDSEYKSTVESLKADKALLQEKVNEMTDRIAVMDDEKDRQYAARMDALKAQIQSADERYSQLIDHEKRAQFVWIALAVVAIIAAVAVGMIFGLNQRINYDAAAASGYIEMMLAVALSTL